MKGLVTLTLFLLFLSAKDGLAANPFKYEEFGWVVSDFKEMMLEHCRKRGTPVMDASGILGALGNPHNFRRACGQGLHSQAVPGEKHWAFYYARLAGQNSDQDFLGIQRLIEWNGATYSLVVSWETRRQIKDGQADQAQAYPSIVLFQRGDNLWQPVWNYSNAVTNDWNDPWDYGKEPDWTTLSISDLKSIQMEYITGEYPGVFWNLKDARGMGFP